MTTPRLSPPFWQHDGYTLRQLASRLTGIVARLAPTPQATVVDMGAGAAPYRSLFEQHGARYIACDLEPPADLVILPGSPVSLADGVARFVVSFQVLEHVWDLDWYLGEARRLLAADGVLVLSTHGTWLYHPHPTDFRRWTRDGLVRELSERGFQVDSIVGAVGPLAWTTQFRALGYHHLLCAVPVVGKLLSAVASSFFHLRMLVEDRITPQAWKDTNAAVYVLTATRKTSNGDVTG